MYYLHNEKPILGWVSIFRRFYLSTGRTRRKFCQPQPWYEITLQFRDLYAMNTSDFRGQNNITVAAAKCD